MPGPALPTRARVTLAGVAAIAATAGVMAAAPAAYATAAPSITAPTDGQSVCVPSGGTVDVSGTAPAGATVSVIDGTTPVGTSVLADGTGVWNEAIPLGDGTHSLTATADDGSGTSSASDPPVSVTVATQQPASVTVNRATFSPKNQDGRLDTATVSTVAPADGTMQLSIVKGATTVVQSNAAQVTQGQPVSMVWDGRNSGGTFVASGVYQATLAWTQTGCETSTVTTPVKVDNVAPSAAIYDKNYSTFFPRHDDAFLNYRDNEVMAARNVDEAGNVRLQLFKGTTASPFRTLNLGQFAPGRTAKYSWNGRKSSGAIYPAGTYKFRFVLRDAVGNVRTTSKQSFALSLKHVVRRTTSVQHTGLGYAQLVNASTCGFEVSHSTDYAHGAWLDFCGFSDSDAGLLLYNFHAPSAVTFGSVHPYIYGKSDFNGTSLPCLMHRFTDDAAVVESGAGPTEKLHWLTKRYGNAFVKNGRSQLIIGYAGDGVADYSVKYIGIKYVYGALAA